MWEQIAANRRKSILLVILAAIVLLALGWVLGEHFLGKGMGPAGMVLAGIVWLVMTLVSWFQGDNIMLSMAGAKKVQKEDLPILFNVVEEMTLASGLPRMPDVYVIDDPAPNAFATGRRPETAAVAVTSGLLRQLSRDELQGVVAHELAHVRNRDIQLMLFAGVLVGAIVIIAEVGMRGMWFGGGRSRSRRDSGGEGGNAIMAVLAIVMMILAPILAQLIYLAVSRKREYLADASAATFTRYPEGLASALEKISRAPHTLGSANKATAPMYIVNPLKRAGKMGAKMAANSTSTHPPIDERVRILRSMSGGGFAAYDESYREVHGGKGVIPGSALKEDSVSGGREAAAAGRDRESGSASQKTIARQVDDFFYRSAGYRRIECDCGTTLKIPSDFQAKKAECPRCGAEHSL
jgi:heat shock protein HtpX